MSANPFKPTLAVNAPPVFLTTEHGIVVDRREFEIASVNLTFTDQERDVGIFIARWVEQFMDSPYYFDMNGRERNADNKWVAASKPKPQFAKPSGTPAHRKFATWLRHLFGNVRDTMGLIFGDKDGNTRQLAFDIDNHEDGNPTYERDLELILDVLREIGIPSLVFRSKSGNGYHVRIFFSEPILQSDIFHFGRLLVRVSGIPEDTEVFPKQEVSVTGSQMWCFGSRHWRESPGRGSTLVDGKVAVPFLDYPKCLEAYKPPTKEQLYACREKLYEIAKSKSIDPASTRAPTYVPQIGFEDDDPGRAKWNAEKMGSFLNTFAQEFTEKTWGGKYTHKFVLECCPGFANHSKQEEDTTGACILVNDGTGEVGFKCHHKWCDKNLDWKLARKLIDPHDQFRLKQSSSKTGNRLASTVYELQGTGEGAAIQIDPVPSEALISNLLEIGFADDPQVDNDDPQHTEDRDPSDGEVLLSVETYRAPQTAKERLRAEKDKKWPRLGRRKFLDMGLRHSIAKLSKEQELYKAHSSIVWALTNTSLDERERDKICQEAEKIINIAMMTLKRILECGMAAKVGKCPEPTHGVRSKQRRRCENRAVCPACGGDFAEILCGMLKQQWPDRSCWIATRKYGGRDSRMELTGWFQNRSDDCAWVWFWDLAEAHAMTFDPNLFDKIRERAKTQPDVYSVTEVTCDQAILFFYQSLREPSTRFSKFFDLYRNAMAMKQFDEAREQLKEICNFPFLERSKCPRYGSSKAAKDPLFGIMPIPKAADIRREGAARAKFGKPEGVLPGCCDALVVQPGGVARVCNLGLHYSAEAGGKNWMDFPSGTKNYVANRIVSKVAALFLEHGPDLTDAQVVEFRTALQRPPGPLDSVPTLDGAAGNRFGVDFNDTYNTDGSDDAADYQTDE